MKTFTFIILAFTIFSLHSSNSNAGWFNSTPKPKNGSCPSGYYVEGKYCVPREDAKPMIQKIGSCPSGYHSSGNYCVGNSSNAPNVFIKRNSCPSGYHSSGNYCVGN